MSEPVRQLLTGWGRTSPTATDVLEPSAVAELQALVERPPSRGWIARGLGRAYGDAAQNAGGGVLSMLGCDRLLEADWGAGRVLLEAGMSVGGLLARCLPHGWFVPVTPGTRHVTVGGALAADIHGKNHHGAGSFARHVLAFDLLMADGTIRRVTPNEDADLFWATAGGMGLTGVVASVELQLRPVGSAYLEVETTRAADLDGLMMALETADARWPYSVGWIDAAASGSGFGRGIVSAGDHASAARAGRDDPLGYSPTERVAAPGFVPPGLLTPLTVRAFNEVWYRRAPRRPTLTVEDVSSFFHPLDAVRGWNRVYGPGGFVQYQFAVPFRAGRVVQEVIEGLQANGTPSFLGVLKRFGPGTPGPLSFPTEGWTLALDLPAGGAGLGELLDAFDKRVAEEGGRVYLAKDGRMAPELLPLFYPRIDAFRSVRARVDPRGVFTSDLARRLSLC